MHKSDYVKEWLKQVIKRNLLIIQFCAKINYDFDFKRLIRIFLSIHPI